MVVIERDGTSPCVDRCLSLARSLENGFNEAGLASMAEDLPEQTLFVARSDGDVVGFASVDDDGKGAPELTWIAVADEWQGRGIGRRLLRAVETRLAATGARLLTVKTLAATVESEHYAGVRRFYEREGFVHVETIDPYPDWEPGNPCAIYARPVGDGGR